MMKSNLNNVLDQISPDICCGCGVCSVACSQGCIMMEKDSKGFLHPVKTNKNCTNCGICLKKCPVSKMRQISALPCVQTCYAGYLKDKKETLHSSSGGIFYALGIQALKRGGYVCGAVWSSHYTKVIHKLSNHPQDLELMRESKYIQSDKGRVYEEIREKLQEGA